jgi:hypothetical protein
MCVYREVGERKREVYFKELVIMGASKFEMCRDRVAERKLRVSVSQS